MALVHVIIALFCLILSRVFTYSLLWPDRAVGGRGSALRGDEPASKFLALLAPSPAVEGGGTGHDLQLALQRVPCAGPVLSSCCASPGPGRRGCFHVTNTGVGVVSRGQQVQG